MQNWQETIGKDGRHLVHSMRTGKTYVVEAITPNDNLTGDWGDYNPATKKVTKFVTKERSAILAEESVITEDNGFKNIETIKGGSPYSLIHKIDSQYPDIRKS